MTTPAPTFHSWWVNTVERANAALDPGYDFGTERAGRSVLGRAFGRARDLYSSGDPHGAVELAQLHSLIGNLEAVKEGRPESYGRYKVRLLSSEGDVGAVIGERAEVALEAIFLRTGHDYDRSERPDFWVRGYGAPVGVECTAARVFTSVKGPAVKAVAKLMEKHNRYKNDGWYQDGPAVLFLDATSLKVQAGGIDLPSVGEPDEVEVAVRDSIDRTHFDFVFIFAHVHIKEWDRSGVRGRYINNAAPSAAATGFVEAIESSWLKGPTPPGFLSPDI